VHAAERGPYSHNLGLTLNLIYTLTHPRHPRAFAIVNIFMFSSHRPMVPKGSDELLS
jgi:hypothetical protein